MNQPFLSLYTRLITNPKQQSATGLWLAHGNEPLMSQWLVDALRPIWQNQGQSVTRIELVSAKTWQEVLSQLNSLSLFDPANTIIVTGNHKPDKSMQAELTEFANLAQQGQTDNHLLWITPKQDKRSLSAKWAQAFNQLGLIIDCNLHNEQQRQHILQQHANQFGLQLNAEAWQLLMSHTQNHLLSAYQSLWRLSYLLAPKMDASHNDQSPIKINAEQLQNGLVSESSYSVFDLSDAMLAGNATQVVNIIDSLKHTNEPTTLVLWAISQEMRRIQQLLGGKDPNSIGIWRSKQSLYLSAVNRHSNESTKHWASMLLKCDQSIKGVIKQPAWELLLQLSLAVCGITLFA